MSKDRKRRGGEAILYIAIFLLSCTLVWMVLIRFDRENKEYSYAQDPRIKEEEVSQNPEMEAKVENETPPSEPPEDWEEESPNQTEEEMEQSDTKKENSDEITESEDSDKVSKDKGVNGDVPGEEAGDGTGEGVGPGDGSGGEGPGGDGTGIVVPEPTATPIPTAKPVATPKPTVKPTATPKPTETPKVTVTSVTAKWKSGVDSVFFKYGAKEEEVRTKLQVTAHFEDGTTKTLGNNEYQIIGFSAAVGDEGARVFWVMYNSKRSSAISYQVGSEVKSIGCSWSGGETVYQAYEGENIHESMIYDDVIKIWAVMADNSKVSLDPEQITVTGVNKRNTASVQNCTITYKLGDDTFTTTAKCKFNARNYKIIEKYYQGTTLVHTTNRDGDADFFVLEAISKKVDKTKTYSGDEYHLDSDKSEVKVDGKNEAGGLSYLPHEHDFEVEIILVYQL